MTSPWQTPRPVSSRWLAVVQYFAVVSLQSSMMILVPLAEAPAEASRSVDGDHIAGGLK